ncbi:MAG: UPF0175 family protein [Tannerella sp.]|jgi:predicted HTH domain antitoxin|nr:UPF0175 family protein [Tannerella sp.]
MMKQLTIPLSEKLLLSMNMNSEELASSMLKEYGQKLYQMGKLTLSQSAEFSDINLYEFISLLTLSGIPIIDYSPVELENELKQF